MSIDEYFKDWMKVIDRQEAMKIMGWLKTINPNILCPSIPNIFKAFELCSLEECKAVFIGLDPYPDKYMGKTRATGILFGNDNNIPEDKLSPSLDVIKETVINFEIPHNVITFDNSLESWAKQGILMLNSALTCELNKIGSHVNQWRPFISKLIKNISDKYTGVVYVLFGKQAQTLKPYINNKFNHIIEIEHPAYFARTKQKMPDVFTKVNNILYGIYGETIKWFNEEKFESNGRDEVCSDNFYWPSVL